MDMIIIVTGTPGVGKTVFAKELARLLEWRYVDLNDLLIKLNLIEGYDAYRKAYIIDTNNAWDSIKDYLLSKNSIVDSHIAQDIIPRKYVHLCIVLRCEPNELVRRLKAKSYNSEKIRENVQAEILDVIYADALSRYGSDRVISVDVTKGVLNKAIEIYQYIRRGVTPLSDNVNWLTEENFRKFFMD